MLTTSFLRGIENHLGKKLGKKIHFKRVSAVSGGSINSAARLDTNHGAFFLKSNDAFLYPEMFEKEARGLQILRETKVIAIPEVIMTGDEDGTAFLILRFIDSKPAHENFWKNFGMALAILHKNTNPKFGFREDNYIGSLHQSNKEHNKWTDFFIEERLEKQIRIAIQSGRMNTQDHAQLKKLYEYYESLEMNEPPSLLHGDLWKGNIMSGNDGEPSILDPAVYFGNREMDLSMTKLFGGFDQTFYDAYNHEFPLKPGSDERVDIHNLYPLLVHVNLFGGSYISQVRTILKKYN